MHIVRNGVLHTQNALHQQPPLISKSKMSYNLQRRHTTLSMSKQKTDSHSSDIRAHPNGLPKIPRVLRILKRISSNQHDIKSHTTWPHIRSLQGQNPNSIIVQKESEWHSRRTDFYTWSSPQATNFFTMDQKACTSMSTEKKN
jgi:hypothetical protein